jgi:hypothetical protein
MFKKLSGNANMASECSRNKKRGTTGGGYIS